MQTIIFEDEHVYGLFPVTLGRPAYAVLCGSYRLIDWIEKLDVSPKALVRDYLQDVQAADYPAVESLTALASPAPTLWINARLVPSRVTYHTLRVLRDQKEPGVIRVGSAVAAAVLPSSAPAPPRDLSVSSLGEVTSTGAACKT